MSAVERIDEIRKRSRLKGYLEGMNFARERILIQASELWRAHEDEQAAVLRSVVERLDEEFNAKTRELYNARG